MATLRGVTSEYVDAIEGSVIDSAYISGDSLILVNREGDTLYAGDISIKEDGSERYSFLVHYPIGTVMIRLSGGNPAAKLGGGHWRVLKTESLLSEWEESTGTFVTLYYWYRYS